MYGKDFYERLNIQQICNFILNGVELCEYKYGSHEERRHINEKRLTKSLYNYRDKILSFNWDEIENSKKDMKTEDLFQEVILAHADLKDLSFEVGFVAGMLLFKSMNYIDFI